MNTNRTKIKLLLSLFILTSLLVYSNTANTVVLEDEKTEESTTPQYVPGEVLVKFKEGADPDKVLREVNLAPQHIERIHSIKARVSKFKKDYKLEKDSNGWYWFLGKNYKEIDQIPDEEIFKEIYTELPETEKDLYRSYKVTLPEDVPVEEAVNNLKKNPDVEYAEPNLILTIQMIPNDPYYSSSGSWGQPYDDLWGLKKIQCGQAWDISQGEGVVVAVIDTGVDYNHEDISQNIWTNPNEIPANGIDDDNNGYIDDIRGWDFVGPSYTNPVEDNDPMDDHGHGTHTSGTVAAIGNNGLGVIGVAPRVKIMAVKGLDRYGSGPSDVLAEAVRYAASNGAHVLSNSWGGSGTSQTLTDAFHYANDLGRICITSAGNSADDVKNYTPASIDTVIAVAASDTDDTKCTFSNYGERIDVSAPGGTGRGWEKFNDASTPYGYYVQTKWEGNYCIRESNYPWDPAFGAGSKYLYAKTGPDCGIVDIYMNNVFHKSIDLYSPTAIWRNDIPIEYDNSALSMKIQVNGGKNPESSGIKFIFGGLQCGSKSQSTAFFFFYEPSSHQIDYNILSLRSNNNGTPTGYSNYIVGDKYYRMKGTSMACPHVSGLAALIISAHPEFSKTQVESRILGSTLPIDDLNPDWRHKLGSGRIDALNALTGANLHPHLVIESVSSDGDLLPSSTRNLILTLKNKGEAAANITCTLTSDEPMVAINKTSSIFGDIAGGAAKDNSEDPFTITLDASINYGKPLKFKISISGDGDYQREMEFELRVYSPIKPGWPFVSHICNGSRDVILSDLDNDGKEEIIVYGQRYPQSGVMAPDSYLFVLKANGEIYSDRWPLFLSGRVISTISSADLDNDGKKDLVADTNSNDGQNYKKSFFNYNAEPIGEISFSERAGASLLEDIDNDGTIEVVYCKFISSNEFQVCAYDYMGNLKFISNAIPIYEGTEYFTTSEFRISTGDIDGDGLIEVVGAGKTGGDIVVVRHDGTVNRIPVGLSLNNTVLGDINRDGNLEIIVFGVNARDYSRYLCIYTPSGDELLRQNIADPASREPSICNVDSDDELEILFSNYDKICAFNHDGTNVDGNWPFLLPGSPNDVKFTAVGDIDGDGEPDVLLPSEPYTSGPGDFTFLLNACDQYGNKLSNWPIYTQSSIDVSKSGNIAIGDIDKDGKVEVVLVQDSAAMTPLISVNVYELGTFTNRLDWPMFRHDAQRTGCYKPLPPPNAISISPNQASIGATVTITGTNFGYTQGTGFVEFYNGVRANIQSWSDTEIVCTVPQGAKSGQVFVTDGSGKRSNGLDFLVAPSSSYIPSRYLPATNQDNLFTTEYSDPDGYQTIDYVEILVNNSTSFSNCTYTKYDRVNNKLYLKSDDGSTWLGGITPGSYTSIENSYARLVCRRTKIEVTGSDKIQITWCIYFKDTMGGAKKIYLNAKDLTGAESSLQEKASITIDHTPKIVSLSPSYGTYYVDTPYTFTTVYSDLDGYSDLRMASILISTGATAGPIIYAYYERTRNALYLYNGSTFPGGYSPGSSYIIDTPYGKLYCSQTTVSTSGNNLTITWRISFKSTVTGSKTIYLNAHDMKWINSGWKNKGYITIR